jgi:nitroreductase
MPEPNTAAMDFLLARRSHPARTLALPVPGRDEIARILTAAARVPDHGKLEPWRFLVFERAALLRLAALAEARGEALGLDPERRAKGVAQYAEAHLAVAVIHVPRSTEKIPAVEQVLSAGAVCLSLLNAALASGWGANWLTGWAAEDETFRREGLGLAPGEWVAGIVYIGSATSVPPDRPRPDLAKIATWVSA